MFSDSFRISPLQTLVLSVLLAISILWILHIGQGILLPILIAVISVYILETASETLGRMPLTRVLPGVVRRVLVILIFVLSVSALVSVTLVTVEMLVERAPIYQQNVERALAQTLALFGVTQIPDVASIRNATIGQLNAQVILASFFSSVSSLSGLIFMAVIYAIFLMGERASFSAKLLAAFPRHGDAHRTQQVIDDINERIGEYLAVKTLINIILGTISFVILWLFDVDFPLFWALLIGLLNYIPYFGSMLGVLCPVLLSVVQFGSLQTTVLLAVCLITVQMLVGNILEPKMVGKQLNLSPFVVLVSLAFWSAIWGLAGAILAIPLTSMVSIVLGTFDATRPLAVLLAQDVSGYARTAAASGVTPALGAEPTETLSVSRETPEKQ